VALKAQAFGRTRHGGKPVDRDFSDVVLLLDNLLNEIVAQVAVDQMMRRPVVDAATRLLNDHAAVAGAVRELVATGAHDSVASARRATERAATRCTRQLGS